MSARFDGVYEVRRPQFPGQRCEKQFLPRGDGKPVSRFCSSWRRNNLKKMPGEQAAQSPPPPSRNGGK